MPVISIASLTSSISILLGLPLFLLWRGIYSSIFLVRQNYIVCIFWISSATSLSTFILLLMSSFFILAVLDCLQLLLKKLIYVAFNFLLLTLFRYFSLIYHYALDNSFVNTYFGFAYWCLYPRELNSVTTRVFCKQLTRSTKSIHSQNTRQLFAKNTSVFFHPIQTNFYHIK